MPPFGQRKNCQKSGKRVGKSRNRGKIGKKRQKSGRFFHFAPLDKIGLATLLLAKYIYARDHDDEEKTYFFR